MGHQIEPYTTEGRRPDRPELQWSGQRRLVFEGGGDVGGDVVGIFGADGEADEAVGDADGGALGGGEGAVGGVAGVEDEGVDVADGCGRLDHLEGFEEAEDFGLAGVFELEGDDGAVAALAEEAGGQLVLGMIGEARVADAGKGGMAAQLFGDSGSVAALALDAQGHGFEAAVKQPGFVGAEVGAGLFEKIPEGGAELVSGDDDAAQDIAVAADILGGAVNDDVGSVGKGPEEHGGGEGVVDEQTGVVGAAELGKAGDVYDFEEWIGDGLDDEDDGRLFNEHALDGIKVGGVDEEALCAILGPEAVDEGVGGAVAVLGGGDGYAGPDAASSHGEVDCGHAAGGGEREVVCGLCGHVVAFEVDDGVLEGGDGRVAVAAVDVEVGVSAEGAVEVGGVLVDVADAGDDTADDGRGGGAGGGRGIAAFFAAMDGFAVY